MRHGALRSDEGSGDSRWGAGRQAKARKRDGEFTETNADPIKRQQSLFHHHPQKPGR